MNPHHIQITSLQLTDITKLLHHIPLRVNREVGKPRSLRPRAQAIGGDPQDLASPHKHCNMKADQICLAHSHRVRILQEPLHQSIITCANRAGHLEIVEGVCLGLQARAVQFYPSYGRFKLYRTSRREMNNSESMEIIITLGGNEYIGSVTKTKKSKNGSSGQTQGEQGQGEQGQEQNGNGNEGMSGGRRKMKKMKAKGTRKLSPYMKFAQQARKEILAENPGLKSDIIAVGKKIGEKWRALSDAEKAKY